MLPAASIRKGYHPHPPCFTTSGFWDSFPPPPIPRTQARPLLRERPQDPPRQRDAPIFSPEIVSLCFFSESDAIAFRLSGSAQALRDVNQSPSARLRRGRPPPRRSVPGANPFLSFLSPTSPADRSFPRCVCELKSNGLTFPCWRMSGVARSYPSLSDPLRFLRR